MDNTQQQQNETNAMGERAQKPLETPQRSAAIREAHHWYNCFRNVAYQTPLPMVASDPTWDELPEWYQDVLASAMELFLQHPTAATLEEEIALAELAYQSDTALIG